MHSKLLISPLLASLVAQMVKKSICKVGDLGSIPGSGRSTGEEHGNPPWYSCLENPMDRGVWWGHMESMGSQRVRLRDQHTHNTGPALYCGPPEVIPLPHPLLPLLNLFVGFCFQWLTAILIGVPMCLIRNFPSTWFLRLWIYPSHEITSTGAKRQGPVLSHHWASEL